MLFGSSLDRNGKLLAAVVVSSVLLRIVYMLLFVDLNRDYYWEYGKVAEHIHQGKGYSLFDSRHREQVLAIDSVDEPLPSAYMPPGYVLFLLPFFSIENIVLRNILILSIQFAAASTVVIGVYVLGKKFLQPPAALVAAALPRCCRSLYMQVVRILQPFFIMRELLACYVCCTKRKKSAVLPCNLSLALRVLC